MVQIKDEYQDILRISTLRGSPTLAIFNDTYVMYNSDTFIECLAILQTYPRHLYYFLDVDRIWDMVMEDLKKRDR